MKLGITGTRNGLSDFQARGFVDFMSKHQPSELHHGGCQGVDLQLADITIRVFRDVKIVTHLPNKREARYLIERNHDIVNCSDFLLVFPDGKERLRSGTWATTRYANKVKKTGMIIYPDGREEEISKHFEEEKI